MSDITKNKYLNGHSADAVQFENQAAMLEAMKDKRYHNDPEYRDLVTHMLRKPFMDDEKKAASPAPTSPSAPTNHVLETAMSNRAGARRLDDEAIFREQSAAMFGDPRYAKSPSYRREVEDWIRANTPAIDAAMPKGSLIDRNIGKGATRIVFGEGSAEASRQSRDAKREADDRATLAEKHARVDRGESSEMTDLGGVRH